MDFYQTADFVSPWLKWFQINFRRTLLCNCSCYAKCVLYFLNYCISKNSARIFLKLLIQLDCYWLEFGENHLSGGVAMQHFSESINRYWIKEILEIARSDYFIIYFKRFIFWPINVLQWWKKCKIMCPSDNLAMFS